MSWLGVVLGVYLWTCGLIEHILTHKVDYETKDKNYHCRSIVVLFDVTLIAMSLDML